MLFDNLFYYISVYHSIIILLKHGHNKSTVGSGGYIHDVVEGIWELPFLQHQKKKLWSLYVNNTSKHDSFWFIYVLIGGQGNIRISESV